MPLYLEEIFSYIKMRLKIEDVMFWILILAALAVILWLLKGSPTLENGLISIGIFIISSEVFLWRELFKIDKNTAISFSKLKVNINTLKEGQETLKKDINELKNGQEKIIEEIVNVKKLIKPIAK